MKLGRILLAGVCVVIFNAIFGGVTCGWWFKWIYTVPPTVAWKPMTAAPGATYFIGSLLLSILLTAVYVRIYNGIPGKTVAERGMNFGFYVWAVGILPGMFATDMFMNVAFSAIIYMTVTGLIRTACGGLIIGLVYGKAGE